LLCEKQGIAALYSMENEVGQSRVELSTLPDMLIDKNSAKPLAGRLRYSRSRASEPFLAIELTVVKFLGSKFAHGHDAVTSPRDHVSSV
jgi:hypothetical protein